MALIRGSAEHEQAYFDKRMGYRSKAELTMREHVVEWGRALWPEARVVHELVVGRGEARADLAFVSPDRLVAAEIKSQYDGVERLLNQICRFRLISHELWLFIDPRHIDDAELCRYLIPSIGIGTIELGATEDGVARMKLVELPAPAFSVHREAFLCVLWRDELYAEASRHMLSPNTRATHGNLVKAMMKNMTDDEICAAVCRQLRRRDAFWRADPPIGREPNPETQQQQDRMT